MIMDMEQVWDPLRKKMVALTPEEKVRQWFIGVLKIHFKVPGHMMMSEVSLKFGQKDLRTDILVYSRTLQPLLVVECKREDVDMTAEVLEQALRYNLVLGVRFLAITNGHRTLCFIREGEAFRQIRTLPDWHTMQEFSRT